MIIQGYTPQTGKTASFQETKTDSFQTNPTNRINQPNTRYYRGRLLFGLLFGISMLPWYCKAQQVNASLELFLHNQIREAETSLYAIMKQSAIAEERGKAGVALALIHKLNENSEEKVKCYVEGLSQLKEPDAYTYTLWGDCGFHLYPTYAAKLQQFFSTRTNIHPDIRFCLEDLKRRQFIYNGQADSLQQFLTSHGYIRQWELVGPFDYNDGYGFYNDEQTRSHSDRTYEFHGRFNAPLNWFPMMPGVDAMGISLSDYIETGRSGASRNFAQTFIVSDQEQDADLSVVCGSDLRCWLNDQLLYENRLNIENITYLPSHIRLHLHKGCNRLLLEMGKQKNYSYNLSACLRGLHGDVLPGVQAQLTQRTYTHDQGGLPPVIDPEVISFNVGYFTSYLQQHPGDILEQLLRIEELNGNGDKTKTLKVLMPLYEKYPDSYYLSNLYYNNKPNINYSTKDDYLNQKCEKCFSTLNKKYEEAVSDKDKARIHETMEQLEQAFPGNQSVFLHQLDFHLQEGEYTEAEKLIDDGLKKYDNRLMFCRYKANLLKSQSRKNEQVAYLTSILPGRTNTFVSDQLKDYYLDNQDTTSWIRQQQEDMRWDESEELYYSLTNIFIKSRRFTEADTFFQRLLLKKPYSARAWEAYGDFLLKRSEKNKAVECFRKSLLFDPMDNDLVRKVNNTLGEKPEIDQLLPQTLKEIYVDEKVKDIQITDNLKSKNWVILLRRTASVTYLGGMNVSRSFLFYKILNEAGIGEFKEFSGGLGSDVMIFKADGQVVLPESGFSSVVMTNLGVGDIIGVKSENTFSAATEYCTTRINLQLCGVENDPLICLHEEHLLSHKLKLEPYIYDPHKLLRMDHKEWNHEFTLYTIRSTQPGYMDAELYPMDPLMSYAYVSLQNYQSWKEIANWYQEIAAPSLVSNDSIHQLVSRLLSPHPGMKGFEKAQLLYRWLEKNLNYSSQAFRQDNYVPQPANKVFEDRLGDCKDLSALYIVLCREAGLKAHFCLVNMDSRAGTNKQYPNINFNHCIVRVYADGHPYFVELTSRNLPFACNLNYAVFGYGLEIDSTDMHPSPVRIWNEGKSDYVHLASEIRHEENGRITMKGRLAILGMTTSVLRDAFEKIDSAQIQTAIQKLLADLIPNTAIEKAGLLAKTEQQDTLWITFEATCPDIFIDVADLYIYKFPVFMKRIIDEALFANPNRKTALSLPESVGMIGEAVVDTRVYYPGEKTVFRKPAESHQHNAYFDFDVTVSEKPREINLTRRFSLHAMDVAPEQFPVYKQEVEKLYKQDACTLVLQ